MLLGNADLQQQIIPLCTKQDFEGLASERIFSILMDGFGQNQRATYESMHRHFAGETEQALLAQLEIEDVPESLSKETEENSLNALRTMRLSAYKRKILAKIAEAAEQKDDEMLNRLFEQRVLVDRELMSLSRK